MGDLLDKMYLNLNLDKEMKRTGQHLPTNIDYISYKDFLHENYKNGNKDILISIYNILKKIIFFTIDDSNINEPLDKEVIDSGVFNKKIETIVLYESDYLENGYIKLDSLYNQLHDKFNGASMFKNTHWIIDEQAFEHDLEKFLTVRENYFIQIFFYMFVGLIIEIDDDSVIYALNRPNKYKNKMAIMAYFLYERFSSEINWLFINSYLSLDKSYNKLVIDEIVENGFDRNSFMSNIDKLKICSDLKELFLITYRVQLDDIPNILRRFEQKEFVERVVNLINIKNSKEYLSLPESKRELILEKSVNKLFAQEENKEDLNERNEKLVNELIDSLI